MGVKEESGGVKGGEWWGLKRRVVGVKEESGGG